MRSFKRILAIILATTMVLTTFGMVAASAASYSDTQGHWAENYINIWSDNGVIQGDGGYFRPDDAITRAEVAQVTQNVIGYVNLTDNTFYDVPAGAWYEDAVLKLVAAGTLTGNGDGTMLPDNYMTREETMTMLARAYGLTVENSQAGITQYSDYQSVSDYATGYVGAMTAAGYVGGYEDGTIRPQAFISRAEFVKILDNMIKLYITAPGTYGPAYAGGITMVKSGGVTLSGIVGNAAIVSPQVSGSVNIQGCQFAGGVINKSGSANVVTDSSNNASTGTGSGVIMGGNNGAPGGNGPGNGGSVAYTVNFYVDNTVVSKQNVTRNGYLKSIPKNPYKEDMSFVGWYSSKKDADNAATLAPINVSKLKITKNPFNLYAGFVPKGTEPSAVPSDEPSAAPSAAPSVAPSAAPSAVPSAVPSAAPSAVPSAEPSVEPSAAVYKATLDVKNGSGTLKEATAAAAEDLPADEVWTILDADLLASVSKVTADKTAFETVRGLSGYGNLKTGSSKKGGGKYIHNGKTYTFGNNAFVAGSGSKTNRCFYFTPKQACVVTVAYATQAGRPVYIYQGDTLLASGEEGVTNGNVPSISADVEDPSKGDVYVYGGSSDKDIYGIFADYYDPSIVVYRTLSGNINYSGAVTGLKVVFTDEKDGTKYEVNGANGAYTVSLRQNRNYKISVVDADGNVSDSVAPTLDTNSVSITKIDKTADINLVDIALTEVTGDVTVHDYNNDGTSLDLSGVQLTFTAKDDASYKYTTGITNNKISVSMMPNHEYAVTATGIDGYELSQLSQSYLMAAGDTKPFKNILIREVLSSVPFSATVKVGADKPYAKINDAIAAISKMSGRPAGEDGRVTVEIDPGTYTEQVIVSPNYVTLKAADETNRPKLEWYYGIGYIYYSAKGGYYDEDCAVAKTSKDSVTRWGSAVRITGQNVNLENLVVENTFSGRITDAELADGVESAGSGIYGDVQGKPDRTKPGYDPKTKNAVERAAAIALDGGNTELYKCDFISSQDTFYTNKNAYVKECYIEGGTDFIFGGNSILFEDCTLAWHGYSDGPNGGYLTACQNSGPPVAGEPNINTNGYKFVNTTVTTSKYYPSNKFDKGAWGRNWGGDKCQVIFDGVKMEGIAAPSGWTKMGGELSGSVLFVNNVTDKDGKAVNVSGTAYNPNGTMESKGYSIIDDYYYFGDGWKPPHYEKEIVTPTADPNAPIKMDFTSASNQFISSTTSATEDYVLSNGRVTISKDAKYHNDHGLSMPAGDSVKVNVEGDADIEIGSCQYSGATVTVKNGETVLGTVVIGKYSETLKGKCYKNDTSAVGKYSYKGEAATLTLNFSEGVYCPYIGVKSTAVAPSAAPSTAPSAEPSVEPSTAPSTAPSTEPADPNTYYFEEGTVVAYAGTPSVEGAAAKMTVTKVSDNTKVEVSEDNTFVMPAEEVKVSVVYTAPYSGWQQGQAKADTTDGSMKFVDFEGKTALDITGRNVYTVLDKITTEGTVSFNTNVYAGPDTTGFRIYFENSSADFVQDNSKAVQAAYIDGGSLYAGTQAYALAGTTAGWYNVDVLADYSKVAAADFITVTIKDQTGNIVAAGTMAAANGIADGIKQIRLVSRGTAGQSDVYFADIKAKVKGLKPDVNDPIEAQEKKKIWTAADNYDELWSMRQDGQEDTTKFNIKDMNMDNLYLHSTAGAAKLFNYEDAVLTNGGEGNSVLINYVDPEKAGYFKAFSDGLSVPAQVLNARVGTEIELMPSATKAGKLKIYYIGQTAGAEIVTITQGETVTPGVIGDDNETVTVDVKAGEKIVITSDVFGWLAAVSYEPEGSATEPSAAPSAEPSAAPSAEPSAAPSEAPSAEPTVNPIDLAVDFTNEATNHKILTADETAAQWNPLPDFGINADGARTAFEADDAVLNFTGYKFHGDQYGIVPGTLSVKVNGPAKILVGNCNFGGDITVTDGAGNVVKGSNKADNTYDSAHPERVTEIYYTGKQPTTLSIAGGAYVGYYAVKEIDESEIPTFYNVEVAAAQNGTVSVSKTSEMAGQSITITATPEEGYIVDTISVKNKTTNADVEVSALAFTMPDSDVVVTVTFKVKPTEQPSTIDYNLNLKPSGDIGATQQDWVLKDGFVTIKNMKSDNTHGAQGSGPIIVQVPGPVEISLGTCAYDDYKAVVTDAAGNVVATQDDIVGSSQALTAGGNGTYGCDQLVTMNYTGAATTLTISFESSTNGAQTNARFWLPSLRIKSVTQ